MGTVTVAVETALGSPVALADVTVRSASPLGGTYQGRTGAAGEPVLVAGVLAGTLTVEATSNGLRGATTLVLLDGEAKAATVALEPAGRVAGVVTQALGGPAAGVTVRLTQPRYLVATTPADGSFAFDNVPVGAFTVEAEAARGDRGRATGQLSTPGQAADAPITLNGLGTVVVRVVDGSSAPVDGADVTVTSLSPFGGTWTKKTAAGLARFEDVLAGDLDVTGARPGERRGEQRHGPRRAGGGDRDPGDAEVDRHHPGRVVSAAEPGRRLGHRGEHRLPQAGDRSRRGLLDRRPSARHLHGRGPPQRPPAGASNRRRPRRGRPGDRGRARPGRDGSRRGLREEGGGLRRRGADRLLERRLAVGLVPVGHPAAGGYYLVDDVPAGAFHLSATSGLDRREASGTMPATGGTVTVDLVLQSSAVYVPNYLGDAGGSTFKIGKDGGLTRTPMLVESDKTPRLRLVRDGTTRTFAGSCPASGSCSVGSEEGGREYVFTQSNLGGLDVVRKVFVPADGYFVRYLDVITNPPSAPDAVAVDVVEDVVLTGLAGGQPPLVTASASGDDAADPADLWVVLDDPDGDDIWTKASPSAAFAPTVLVSGGAGAPAPSELSATQDWYDATATRRWNGVVVPPGARSRSSTSSRSSPTARARRRPASGWPRCRPRPWPAWLPTRPRPS